MLRRWLTPHNPRLQARPAAELDAWLASLTYVLETCSEALRSLEPGADIVVTLGRVDRELMRFRDHAADIRPRLRLASPSLAETVRRATDDTYHLRNHTHAYLLRSKARQQQTSTGGPYGVQSLREMEEAHIRASEAARRLRSQLAAFSPEIPDVVDAWAGKGWD